MAGLGAAWGTQKALQMLNDAGFASVEVKQVEGDILNNYYICKAWLPAESPLGPLLLHSPH
jgi:Zn-dependent membrane protease YugP